MTVSVTVTSHVMLFPRCHGVRVSPSGRFSSVRDSPSGSKADGVLALVSARYIIIIIISIIIKIIIIIIIIIISLLLLLLLLLLLVYSIK